jgi:hypothetical protein
VKFLQSRAFFFPGSGINSNQTHQFIHRHAQITHTVEKKKSKS